MTMTDITTTNERPTIQQGATGSDVIYLQTALGIPADGDFGGITNAAVEGFQLACGLDDDGVVGPLTWAQVDDLVRRMAAGDDGLPAALKQAIIELAHPILDYEWDDRGQAPPGYIPGLAMCFALALVMKENPAVLEMMIAQGDPDYDALAFYESEFDELGMSNSRPGVATLRHLFVMLLGLGMRESSGRYCEGIDQSASNTSSDTCEAGLFQTSFNIASASPNIPKLLETYWLDPQGFLPVFAEGVNPSASELECFGQGDGARYQWLAKYSPAFATFVTAIGLRRRRSHWGPIGRFEVELVGGPEGADDYLQQVEQLVIASQPAPATPTPSV